MPKNIGITIKIKLKKTKKRWRENNKDKFINANKLYYKKKQK